MKLKDLITDFKFWVGVIIVIAGVVVGFLKFQNLPARIQKVEVKVEEQEGNVDKLANTVDKYVVEQRVMQQEQDKREQLMLKLIELKTK